MDETINNELDRSLHVRSCVNCIHGILEITPAYWEFSEEPEINCNYPNNGNLKKQKTDPEYLNRLGDWAESDGDLRDEAEKCEEYTHYFV